MSYIANIGNFILISFKTFRELLEGYKRFRERERKKDDQLLPFILQRQSTNVQEPTKDDNAPVPRAKAHTMSMQG